MNEKKILIFNTSLISETVEKQRNYEIPITIKNQSSRMGIRKAEVAVKDEDAQYATTVNFGRIEKQSQVTKNAIMPGGVESCLYKIFPDVGDEVMGGGLGDNVGEIIITISD